MHRCCRRRPPLQSVLSAAAHPCRPALLGLLLVGLHTQHPMRATSLSGVNLKVRWQDPSFVRRADEQVLPVLPPNVAHAPQVLRQ